MKTFRTLDLATQFYEEVEGLKLKGHLRDQILRGSSSIALNLSEGNAKFSVDEKKRFYQIAYASLQECRTVLKLLKIRDQPINKTADHLGASLYKLIDSKLISVRK
ncbi:MAG: four helix bundle protein [Pseudobdellovibrionaceae bacterium]